MTLGMTRDVLYWISVIPFVFLSFFLLAMTLRIIKDSRSNIINCRTRSRLWQGVVAWIIGYLPVLIGVLLIRTPLFMTNLFGALLVVVGYQITLWATGIRSELIGNESDRPKEQIIWKEDRLLE